MGPTAPARAIPTHSSLFARRTGYSPFGLDTEANWRATIRSGRSPVEHCSPAASTQAEAEGTLKMKAIKDESGQTVLVVAVFLGIVAMGFLALALDVGYLFRERRMVQSAADAAAVAAAEEVATGNSSNKQAVANAMAKLNGFDTTLAKNPAVVTFPTPTGIFSGSNYVAVTVSKPI